ncbi:putative DYW domain-containing protein [Helianthus debilis subsp. tardiflorus]
MDLAAYAAKRVLDLDPDDAGTYILLSNIYVNTHRWGRCRTSEEDHEKQQREEGTGITEVGYVPDTSFVLHDVEGEQMEDPLLYHSEKLAIVYGLMALTKGKTVRIRKNLRICGDCHLFAKLLAQNGGSQHSYSRSDSLPSLSRRSLLLWRLLVAET